MTDTLIDPSPHEQIMTARSSEIDFSLLFRQALGLVRRNLWIIVGTCVATMALGVILTLLITNKYEASSKILIEDRADQIIEGGDLQAAIQGNDTERFLETQVSIVESRALANAVVEEGKLAEQADFFAAFGQDLPDTVPEHNKSLEDVRKKVAVNLLLKALSVAIPVDSRIATITVTSQNPQMSARLADLYADAFIKYNLNQKYESSGYARSFLANQLEQARAKLTFSEQALNRYARAAGLIRLSNNREAGGQETAVSVTNDQLLQLNQAAAEATAQRITAEDRWKTIADKPPLAVSEINSNNALNQLVTAKAIAEGELADELSTHRDGYSTVKAKRAQLSDLNERINALAGSLKRAVQLNYQAAQEREKSLLAHVDTLREAALTEQDRGVQYSVLKREADTNRTLYESLLARFNQLNASAGSASNNISIVDRAEVPANSSSPNFPLNIAISFVIGLILASAIVMAKELLDDTINSPQDVENKLDLPLLGLIPQVADGAAIDVRADKRSNINEAFRSLLTNLRYSTPTGLPQILAVTSSREGEGKSTTSQTLAADIALLGKKTLIIDMDLRRPTIHRVMKDTRNSGMADYLVGNKDFADVIHLTPSDANLSYVTGLPVPPDPSLLLSGPRFETFIAQARKQFDHIILDCPPLLGLSDVPLIGPHADGVLFVIDASSFHRGAIKSALRRLTMSKSKVLGVSLNRFTAKVGSDDYAYYGYNYYSYGKENA